MYIFFFWHITLNCTPAASVSFFMYPRPLISKNTLRDFLNRAVHFHKEVNILHYISGVKYGITHGKHTALLVFCFRSAIKCLFFLLCFRWEFLAFCDVFIQKTYSGWVLCTNNLVDCISKVYWTHKLFLSARQSCLWEWLWVSLYVHACMHALKFTRHVYTWLSHLTSLDINMTYLMTC